MAEPKRGHEEPRDASEATRPVPRTEHPPAPTADEPPARRAARDAASGRAAPHPDPFGFEGRDLLPDVTGDEYDRGWGDERRTDNSSDPADLRRFLDEKPPHHL
jgi:hypothetical protein